MAPKSAHAELTFASEKGGCLGRNVSRPKIIDVDSTNKSVESEPKRIDPFERAKPEFLPIFQCEYGKSKYTPDDLIPFEKSRTEDYVYTVRNSPGVCTCNDIRSFLESPRFKEEKLRNSQKICTIYRNGDVPPSPRENVTAVASRPVYVIATGQATMFRIELKKENVYSWKIEYKENEVEDSGDRPEFSARLRNERYRTKEDAERAVAKYAEHLRDFGTVTIANRLDTRDDMLSRIKIKDPETLLEKTFVDRIRAENVASESIKKFKKVDDPHFAIAEVTNVEAQSQVSDALTSIFTRAKKNAAAIIIPDYLSSSQTNKLVERALEDVDYTGPIINVSMDSHVACDEGTYGKSFVINDRQLLRGVVLKRASHSFQIGGNFGSLSRFVVRLAKVLTGRDVKDHLHGLDVKNNSKVQHTQAQSRCTIFAIIASGGIGVLEHCQSLVHEEVPLVFLQGSGRLSDFVPKAFIKRFDENFDPYQVSHFFIEECGYAFNKTADKVGRWMRHLIEEGNVLVHQVSNPLFALERVLLSVQHEDDALERARDRYTDYLLAAEGVRIPHWTLLWAKVILSFFVTLFATVQSNLDSRLQTPATAELKYLQAVFNQTLAIVVNDGSGSVLHYFVIGMPILLSLVISIQSDFNYGPKLQALEYGAALVESESYRYRTRTGKYSDKSINKSMKYLDKLKNGELPEDEKEALRKEVDPGLAKLGKEYNATYDTLTARTQLLSESLIAIGAEVGIFDKPDKHDETKKKKKNPKDTEKVKKSRKLESQWKLKKSEMKTGILSGDEYLARAIKESRDMESHADYLARVLVFYKGLSYVVGALSSLFALMHMESWVTVTTSFVASLATIYAFYPLDLKIRALREAVTVIEDIKTQWKVASPLSEGDGLFIFKACYKLTVAYSLTETLLSCSNRSESILICREQENESGLWQALPTEMQMIQKYVDILVENTEATLLSSYHKPSNYGQNSSQIKFLFKFEQEEMEKMSRKRKGQKKIEMSSTSADAAVLSDSGQKITGEPESAVSGAIYPGLISDGTPEEGITDIDPGQAPADETGVAGDGENAAEGGSGDSEGGPSGETQEGVPSTEAAEDALVPPLGEEQGPTESRREFLVRMIALYTAELAALDADVQSPAEPAVAGPGDTTAEDQSPPVAIAEVPVEEPAAVTEEAGEV